MRTRYGIAALVLLVGTGASAQMMDPAADGFAGPFCYLAKPSAMLGGVGAGRVTQVTWDGALYTGEAELCIVTGDPPRPVAVRVKRLGGGYVPLVHYSWLEGDVKLSVSAFAVALSQGADPANFVRLRMERLGDSGRAASIGIGLRHSGGDHRAAALQRREFSPASTYAFDRGCAAIGGRAVCVLPSLPAPSRRYAVAGEPYTGPFPGTQFPVGPTTATLLALWDLGQSKELSLNLQMPWTPLPMDAPQPVEALRKAGYDGPADQVARAWGEELARGMRILLPESKPLETYQASLAYLLMSTDIPKEGRPHLRYPLWNRALQMAEAAPVVEALDRSGRHDLARGILEDWLEQQQASGALSPDGRMDAHCLATRTIASHIWLLGDRAWAEKVYPKLKSAADWVMEAVGSAGPPGSPTWWQAQDALGATAEVATLVGKPEDAAALRSRREEVSKATEGALGDQPLPAEVAPAVVALNRGLPDSPEPGLAAPPTDRVAELCRSLRLTCAEGLATEAGLLSPTAAANLAQLHALRGEQEQAIRDLYAVLVHTGSCQEGFAGGVRPWAERDSGEDLTPDPRFAAAYVGLLRDLLIREQRGELHLFSAFSPEWLQPGKMVGVVNAPTSFGLVTAALQIEKGGATMVMGADWHAPPSRV
ncbi:MAG: hypothetical protein FJX75_08625, partial [Armatimonadetes bacterium]|nr:hypothetical protein [Armatimonadota bacterium]